MVKIILIGIERINNRNPKPGVQGPLGAIFSVMKVTMKYTMKNNIVLISGLIGCNVTSSNWNLDFKKLKI